MKANGSSQNKHSISGGETHARQSVIAGELSLTWERRILWKCHCESLERGTKQSQHVEEEIATSLRSSQ